MARAYEDDLRRKFLLAHDQGKGSLAKLAGQFGVSLGWAKKISAQRRRSGQPERVRHRSGRKPHAGAEAQGRVIGWVAAQPDLTLAELQDKLRGEAGVALSRGRVWYLLRKLGLRLKKSRSTPRSGTRRPTSGSASGSSPRSEPLPRNT